MSNVEYIVNNIKLSINQDVKELKDKVAKKLNIVKSSILAFDVVKESVDARDKNNINFVYSVKVKLQNKLKVTRPYVRSIERKQEDVILNNDRIKLTKKYPINSKDNNCLVFLHLCKRLQLIYLHAFQILLPFSSIGFCKLLTGGQLHYPFAYHRSRSRRRRN